MTQYTLDVDFTSAFGAFQAPIHMAVSAALNNWAPPPVDQPFVYVDLACGSGLTLAMLADAYPHGRFYGLDLNPIHVEQAQLRVSVGGLSNVEVQVGDLREGAALPCPEADFMALAGAYSWLDEGCRTGVRELVGKRLRPGGLFYVDYAAQPGSAQSDALYHILRMLAETSHGDSAEQLSAAVRQAQSLRDRGATFFRFQPLAAARLEDMAKNRSADEAHEVFNLRDGGLWHDEVAREFAKAGLVFAASARRERSVLELMMPAPLAKALNEGPASLRETLIDVSVNAAVRYDVFTTREAKRADVAKTLGGHHLIVAGSADAALSHAEQLNRKTNGALGDPALVNRILEYSALHSASFAQVAQLGGAGGLGVIRALLAANLLTCCAGQVFDRSFPDRPSMSRLNRMLLDESLDDPRPAPLVSPVLGTRIVLPLTDRALLSHLLGEEAGSIARRVAAALGGSADAASIADGMRQGVQRFAVRSGPDLGRLGVVQPT
jgi:SAM-dependent methyltransferase